MGLCWDARGPRRLRSPEVAPCDVVLVVLQGGNQCFLEPSRPPGPTEALRAVELAVEVLEGMVHWDLANPVSIVHDGPADDSEVIIFTCRALVAATKVIVAPIAVPEGRQVEEPEAGEEVATEGAVQAVVADVLLVVLRKELQVVVDPPFGVLAGALDVVPDGIRGLVDTRPVRRSTQMRASSSVVTPGYRSRRRRRAARYKVARCAMNRSANDEVCWS